MIILSNHGILQSSQATISPTETFMVGGYFPAWGNNTKRGLCRVNSDGSLDTSFNTGYGFGGGGSILTPGGPGVVKDSVGNYYIGGNFTSFNGTTVGRIIKISSSGTLDTTFNTNIGTGFNNNVYSIAIDSSDKLYVGGQFTTFNGATNNRIIKLNSNGTKDTSFDNTTGFAGTAVYTIKLDSAGKLYVVGAFTTYKGTTANNIIKLNTDGTKDTSFDNTTGFTGNAYSFSFDSTGKLYVVGIFTAYKGVTANRIIKLNTDGTKDTSFDNSTGFDGTTFRVTVDSSDKIYVSGGFTLYKGTTLGRIVKLNADGTIDTSFDTTGAVSNGFNNIVYDIKFDSTGKLYVVGIFTAYKGIVTPGNGILKLNTDGSIDTSFDTTNALPPVNYAYQIFNDASDKIVLGGIFNAYKTSAYSLVLLNTDGTKNTSFTGNKLQQGTSVGTVYKVAKDSSNNYILAGDFTQYGGVNSQFILKLSSAGIIDSTFTTNIGTGGNSTSYSVAIDASDKIYLGGAFTTFNASANNRIIKLNSDGTKDTSFDNSTGFGNGIVYDIKLDSAGKIYAAGSFTNYKIAITNYMVKLNTDGTQDTSFQTINSFNGAVNTFAFDSAGKIYAGGDFTTFNSVAANRIIKLNTDGTKDTSFDNSTGFNASVNAIAIDSNGKIYVGGAFSLYKGVANNRIIRLNPDGSKDTAFDNSTGFGSGTVRSITFDSAGKLYVAVFNGLLYKGTPYGNVIKLNTDGSIDNTFVSIPGLSNSAYSILKVS